MMDFESAAVPYLPIRRRKIIRQRLLIAAVIAAVVGTVILVRHHLASEPIGERVFNEVATTISVRYYDRTFHGLDWPAIVAEYRPKVAAASSESQRYHLLQEMLSRLGDSHTAVFSPSDVSRVQDQVAQALGAAFVNLGRDRVVVRVAPRSPAATAGLRPGLIVAEQGSGDADGATHAFTVRDPVSGRTWKTRMHLVQNGSYDQVERADVDWGTAAPGIGYLRMASFPNDIQEELGWAVSDLSGHPAMILDLRGNPGGLIDAVDATAGIFLPPGTLVVSGAGRYHVLGQRKFSATDAAHVRYSGRLAVLVDGNSESGAEALASALKIYHRAVIVGEPTAKHVLGVEVEEPLSDGGLLRVATLDMRDANGILLEGTGVTPDIRVSRTPADIARGRDPQLRAAIAALHKM
ncbi:MAG TPA: S41 family peptidase [Candidatus Eremiobacteraceae bacterium]|jgi:carboxyl-terminal processing protease|nr:S41 family peptidase [Candidatus Eremiobacteraceae bacterium]